MPKTPSNYLFKLVQSLTKKERNEILHFIGNKKSATAQLFTAMKKCADTDSPFNEKKLIIKNLPVVKTNLQTTIEGFLMCIATTDSFLRNSFKKFELIRQLIDRGFYTQALQKMEKLKEEAAKREEFGLLSYLLLTENMYYDSLHAHNTAQNKLVKNWEECLIVNQKNLRMVEISFLNAKVATIESSIGCPLPVEYQTILHEVKKQLKKITTPKYDTLKSYKAQSAYLSTQMFIAEIENNQEVARKYSCEDIELLKQYPEWKKYLPTGYAATTLNHLSRYMQTPLHKQFYETLESFDESALNQNLKSLFRPKFLPYIHLHYLYQQKHELLKNIIVEQESYKEFETDSFTLLFVIQNNLQAAVYHIINQDFQLAHENLNWIIEKGLNPDYPEFFLKAYTWNILLLAKQEHKTLQSIIRRFQYHLKEYAAENKFFNQFCNLALKHFLHQFNTIIVATELEKLFPNEVQSMVAEPELDIITWLKFEGNNPHELMQRKIHHSLTNHLD